ncbi:MAG: helix-turn-helix domain-containing protein [Lawsonibacter sp.]|jgi:transcriptional regulator with XRE-family HTH domain
MDYEQIGQRVRHARKTRGFSQEELAERVGISVTHMSHIETGNTKLSLPVLAALATALETTSDWLLSGPHEGNLSSISQELSALLDGCTPQEAQVILETARSVKRALERHLLSSNPNSY